MSYMGGILFGVALAFFIILCASPFLFPEMMIPFAMALLATAIAGLLAQNKENAEYDREASKAAIVEEIVAAKKKRKYVRHTNKKNKK